MHQCLIVFSHLRWSFVYQRPQQLLSRLASRYPVYFFEEPVPTRGESYLEVEEAAPGVHVCRPHTQSATPGFHDNQIPALQRFLDQLVQERGLEDCVLWFYSPMALPLARGLDARAVVYDCMDELSAFMYAPRQLQQRENALLKIADLVFTGGPSLYRAKRSRHPAVHCFPSSVDSGHYSQALDPRNEHPEQTALARPRFGYFGVIDERIDLPMIDSV